MAEVVAPVAPQANEPKEGFCPYCGMSNPSRARFCARCGARLPMGALPDPGGLMPVPAVVQAPQAARGAEALPKAGVPRRTAAFLVDLVVIFVAAVLYGAVAGDTTGNGTTVVLFLGTPIYMIAFEYSRHGATPGKLALGIHVVNDAGMRISIGQAVGRTVLSVLNYFFFFAGFWMAGFRQDGRALNDLGSSTWVVRKEPGR